MKKRAARNEEQKQNEREEKEAQEMDDEELLEEKTVSQSTNTVSNPQPQAHSREEFVLQPDYQQIVLESYQPLLRKLLADNQILEQKEWQDIVDPVAKFIFWDPFYKMEDQPSGINYKKARETLDKASVPGTVLVVMFKQKTSGLWEEMMCPRNDTTWWQDPSYLTFVRAPLRGGNARHSRNDGFHD